MVKGSCAGFWRSQSSKDFLFLRTVVDPFTESVQKWEEKGGAPRSLKDTIDKRGLPPLIRVQDHHAIKDHFCRLIILLIIFLVPGLSEYLGINATNT